MKIRRAGMVAAVAAASITIAAATANADPEQPVSPQVSYQATLSDGAVVVGLEHGTFTRAEETIRIRDAAGTVLDTLPLSYVIDEQQLSIREQISDDGRTLRLTPDLTAVDRTALRPVASPLENQLAMNDLINSVSIGTSVGSLIGTAIGATLGIGVGFALAGASCLVLSLGCVVAVLPIVTLVAGAGGLAGLVIAGAPNAAFAIYRYVTTLNAAPGESIYAPDLQGRAGVPAPTPATGN
ncbi:hypothetical protein HLB23_05180 [Nocardia uniformis]|uniref:DUF8020 domain-containing protein n=1 Tax=Nocardia uniformis TaxID=53432 RepID=A0A849BVX9_9NOCA|nr:hypothetical protein [Nocardia uniformis]NNH69268.1 hypothetical protein [Nocardia uniformis]